MDIIDIALWLIVSYIVLQIGLFLIVKFLELIIYLKEKKILPTYPTNETELLLE
jgi:hypothetical protein